MTKESMMRRQHAGCPLQRAPQDPVDQSCCRDEATRETSSSSVHKHRRKRKVNWNSTKWLFWRLAVGLSMIAAAAAHGETAPDDLEEEFFYAVESRDQTFGESFRPQKNRSLQFIEIPIIPTLPPFSFPPIPPITILFGKPFRMDTTFCQLNA
jgi:hypothetical protein